MLTPRRMPLLFFSPLHCKGMLAPRRMPLHSTSKIFLFQNFFSKIFNKLNSGENAKNRSLFAGDHGLNASPRGASNDTLPLSTTWGRVRSGELPVPTRSKWMVWGGIIIPRRSARERLRRPLLESRRLLRPRRILRGRPKALPQLQRANVRHDESDICVRGDPWELSGQDKHAPDRTLRAQVLPSLRIPLRARENPLGDTTYVTAA